MNAEEPYDPSLDQTLTEFHKILTDNLGSDDFDMMGEVTGALETWFNLSGAALEENLIKAFTSVLSQGAIVGDFQQDPAQADPVFVVGRDGSIEVVARALFAAWKADPSIADGSRYYFALPENFERIVSSAAGRKVVDGPNRC